MAVPDPGPSPEQVAKELEAVWKDVAELADTWKGRRMMKKAAKRYEGHDE